MREHSNVAGGITIPGTPVSAHIHAHHFYHCYGVVLVWWLILAIDVRGLCSYWLLLCRRSCTMLSYSYDKLYQYFHLQLIFTEIYYVSQFAVETYGFADGRCLFKQPQSVLYHWNQYDEEISKKCRSVCLSVCNANKKKKPTLSLLIVER